MPSPLVLKVSVNPRLKNKDERRDVKAHGEGWRNVDVTSHQLADLIGRGVAYSVQVKDGLRRGSNYLASNVASVDIDKGMRIEQALALPFCQKHLTIVYRTPSHTEEQHRFRLVFALERTITKPADQKAINRALAMRLGGDSRATDATRVCYGSDLQPAEVYEGFIGNDVLDELIAEGKTAPHPDSVTGGRLGSVRGRNAIPRDQPLRTRDGIPTTLAGVASGTAVHCPFHGDENASAFVKDTRRGTRYLHCSACQVTWWDSTVPATSYDFDSWDRAVEAATQTNFGNLLPQVTSGSIRPIIHRSASRHLFIGALPTGVTFIKSPKGSGKTTTLVSALDDLLTGPSRLHWDDNGVLSVQLGRVPAQVLLIGHRRALIRDTCARLGLNCYLDDDENQQANEDRKNLYGVCLDSLWKVQRRSYDLVIIDESEQVLAHLLADTLEHREGVFQILRDLLQRAAKVVAMDADLGWITYRTICRLAHAIPGSEDDTSPLKPVNIFYNKPLASRKELLIFRSRGHLLADFEQQVRAGKKIYLTSNSKLKIDEIAAMLREKCPDVKFRDITSSNSNTEELQDFIINIKQRIAEYQVVLTSPSLGTGVDITLDDGVAQVDIVYGLFENLINTHFDIDQQLRRVRSPGEVRVWLSPRTANFETELDAVRSDLVNQKNGLVTMFWGADLTDFAAEVVALQRASKNDLKQNFIAYKAAQGWQCIDVVCDSGMAESGAELLAVGRKRHLAELIERVMTAKPIGQDEYTRIMELQDNNEEVSEAEQLSALRSGLEAFYIQEITPELIALEVKRFRSKVRAYERLVQKRTEAPWKRFDLPEEESRKKLRLLPSPQAVPWLVHTLLASTPVYKDHRFDISVRYCAHDLAPFVRAVEAHRGEIQNLLGKPIPKDLHTKPTSFLGNVLDVIGVMQRRVDTKRQADGSKTYYYSLDQASVTVLDEIVRRRAETKHHWSFVHQLHGIEGFIQEEKEHQTPGGDKFHRVVHHGITPAMMRMLKESSLKTAARFGEKPKVSDTQLALSGDPNSG